MTVDKVVDASAVAAVLFNEPRRDEVLKSFAGATFHAPSLLPAELANVAVKKARRDPANEAHYVAALADLELMPIQYHSVTAIACTETALRHGLWAYDAHYLWLALALNLPLVTLDARLEAVTAAARP